MRMIRTLTLAALLVPSAANAQTTTCATDQIPCRAAADFMQATTSIGPDRGLMKVVIGNICGDPMLQRNGAAQTEGMVAGMTSDAQSKLQTTFSNDAVSYRKYSEAAEGTVRATRSGEAVGIIAGLKSMFTLYPATQRDYCEKMKAYFAAHP